MARDRDDFDDVDDRPAPTGGDLGPLDKMYRDTNIIVLVLFGFCCGIIAAVLSLIAFLTAKDEKAKSNALIVMIVGGIMFALGLVIQFTGALAGMGGVPPAPQ